MKPENGDSVIVHTKKRTYEGILMPRPEIFENRHTIIKLDNGYNIGIENDRITDIEVKKKYAPKGQQKSSSTSQGKKDLPTVSLLSFGGTISSKVDYRTGGTHADYTAEDFVQMLPELEKAATVIPKKVMGIMSEDMNPGHWKEMAAAIKKELEDDNVKGVVVTQGTDTLHFSTAAMAFMLGDLNKPVVFTASQRSIDRGSSDAFMNLLCAVHAAQSDICEVMTCLHKSTDDTDCLLVRGTKVRKMHTARRDAFRPINEMPLGVITQQGKLTIVNTNFKKRPAKKAKLTVNNNFEEKTGLIFVHPGIDPEVFDHYISKKYKGLAIGATALGHVPDNVIPKVAELAKTGCVVVIASQTTYGRVHPHVYTNLRKLSIGCDCVYGEDMMPEVAYVKLGWLLANRKTTEEVKQDIPKNLRGEITQRSDTESFLY